MISDRLSWQITGVLISFVCMTQLFAFPAKDKFWRHNFVEAEAEARQLDRPLLLHFHASWCGPCRQMDAQVLNTADVKRILCDRVVGVKIDLDQHPEIAEKYGVDKIPADVIISPTGKVLSKTEGAFPHHQYVATLNTAERKYFDERALAQKPPVVAPKTDPAPVANLKLDEAVAPTKPAKIIVGLDGFCPVTLWRTREWSKGKPAFGADFQGVRFYFASLADRDDFIAEPTKYAPQLLGCDPVALWETERAIAGTAKYAAYFDGELYLFNALANRERFKQSPPQFTKTRHVKLQDIERADTRIGMKD